MYDPLFPDEYPDTESQILEGEQGLEHVRKWVELGAQMDARSPELALEFYRLTPMFLETKKVYQIKEWAREAIRILDTCKSGDGAAIAYVRSSPRMHRFLAVTGFREWKAIGLTMAKRSDNLASTYFALWPDGLDSLYQNDVKKILDVVAFIAEWSPEEALEFYRIEPNK